MDKLHPITGFIYFTCIIGINILTINPYILAVSFITSLIYAVMLCKIKSLKTNLLLIMPIFLFMVIIKPLFDNNGITPLFYINDNAVTLEAVIYGLVITVLLINTIWWFKCCNAIITTDKFIYLFGRIIPTAALVISMIFRMLPLLKGRFREIDDGQKMMGLKTDKMKISSRIKILVKEISILIAWSLEESIETSDSMEARGYGLKGRTSFHLFKIHIKDISIILVIIVLAGISIYGIFSKALTTYYFPGFYIKAANPLMIISIVSFGVLAIIPIIMEIGERIKWKHLNLIK